jgi:hypothetical protein
VGVGRKQKEEISSSPRSGKQEFESLGAQELESSMERKQECKKKRRFFGLKP